MKLHFITRYKDGLHVAEVLAGATILSNNPIWAVIGAEPVVQPMLFREAAYADWVKDVAIRKDRDANAGPWQYRVDPIEFEVPA